MNKRQQIKKLKAENVRLRASLAIYKPLALGAAYGGAPVKYLRGALTPTARTPRGGLTPALLTSFAEMEKRMLALGLTEI